MSKFNKHTRKYNITEQNLIGFDEIIASIPKNIKKSMVLYKEKFNERILALIESLVQRIENIEKRLDVIEKRVENIEHRLDKLESRIDNLVIKNNLRE